MRKSTKPPKRPTDRLTLNADFLMRWTSGEPIRVDEHGNGRWPDGTPVIASPTLTLQETVDAAALEERRRCVGIVLHEYGLMIAAGEGKIAAVLDTLATRLEHPDLEG